MAIKIGHASRSETKGIRGKAGDQDKYEICIRTWYKSNWNVVLRPKRPDLAEKSAQFVEAICNNPNVGYDQGERNTLFKEAKKVNFDGTKIKTPCECDCSSLQHVAAIAGGANLSYGSNGLTTRTMKNGFKDSGDYEVLTDKKYLTSDEYLLRGDILVKEGSHTVMVLENGSKAQPVPTTSEYHIYKTITDLNLRSSANSSNSSNIVVVIPGNTFVKVIDDTNSKWWKVSTIVNSKHYTGYVSKNFLKEFDISKNETRQVIAHGLNVRTAPKVLSSIVTVLSRNDKFVVLTSGSWGLIATDNRLGYVNLAESYSKKI